MNETKLFLTGGLGNQLFQLAAGLSRASCELTLDWQLGNPRLNKHGEPDILDFVLPNEVGINPLLQPNRLISKLSGYLLRTGIKPNRIERTLTISRLLRLTLEKILYFRYGRCVKVVQASDNGYFEMGQQAENEYLIGYFQSYIWPSLVNVEPVLQSLSLKAPSRALIEFIERFKDVSTVMIHIRLGDYKTHDNFGILGSEYYEIALRDLMKKQKIEKILLFSNEPKVAITYIPIEFRELTYVVPNFSGSASETLEAMRHSSNYIIGNSTLSWWGAKISYKKSARVIAPQPWFRSAVEPTDLIPPGWERIPAFHK